MIAGGYKLDYTRDSISPIVSILDAKIHTNGTIYNAHRVVHYLGLNILPLPPWNANEILPVHTCSS